MAELNRYGEEVGELRVKLPLKLIAMIDGYAHAETLRTERTHGRTDSTFSILSAFFNPKIDEAIVLLRLLSINPMALERNSQNNYEKNELNQEASHRETHEPDLAKQVAEIISQLSETKGK